MSADDLRRARYRLARWRNEIAHPKAGIDRQISKQIVAELERDIAEMEQQKAELCRCPSPSR